MHPKYGRARWVAMLATCVALLVAGTRAHAQTVSAEVLTNDDVIQLVKGDLSRDIIVAKIQTTRAGYDITTPGIVRLSKSRVHWKVIREMIGALQTGRANGTARIVPGTENEVLTNDDIIQMVANNIDAELIDLKMRTTKLGFDLSSAGMVKLNQSKVPSDLIRAMMSPPPAVSAASPVASAAASVESSAPASAAKKPEAAAPATVAPVTRVAKSLLTNIPSEPGIYMRVTDAALTSLEPNGYTAGKTDGTMAHAFTYGIAKVRIKAVIQNPHAAIQTSDGSAEFYFVFERTQATLGGSGQPWGTTLTSPNQFVLLRLDERSEQREVTTAAINAFGAQSGTDAKNSVPFKFTKLRTGVYRVVPDAPLAPGEYGFFPSSASGQGTAGSARLYDFGVRP